MPSLNLSAVDEILCVDLQADAVVFLQAAGIEIKLRVSADGAQVQQLCLELLRRAPATLTHQDVRYLRLAIVDAEVGQFRARVLPYVSVHHDDVLLPGRSNGYGARSAEVRNGRIICESGEKECARTGHSNFHQGSHEPGCSADLRVESLSQSR